MSFLVCTLFYGVILYICHRILVFLGINDEEELGELISELWIAVKWLAVITQCLAIKAGHGLYLAGVFAFYLVDEWRRGRENSSGADEREQQDASDEEESLPTLDPYEDALRLLDLPSHFTRTDLKRAYIEAITWAHPDNGGSERNAQAVNAARDLLAHSRGWK